MKIDLKKILILIASIVILIIGGLGAYAYKIISTGFDIDKTVYVYVDEDKSYDKLLAELVDSAKIKNLDNFKKLATYRGYPNNLKTGRYAIEPNNDIWMVVNKLNRGLQTPTKLTFNNVRLKEDLTQRISSQLMIKNEDLLAVLNDSAKCASYGFTPQTISTMFIPNTYEFYWDTSIDNFLARINKEYKSFWTKAKLEKTQSIGLTPFEVSTLAAIVEEECMYVDEYPVVAGLYLNRLKRGQLLQADPTVKYAVGDFTLKRILNKHLEIDSPYNTYKYKGLPPSPIRVPSIAGINAVLNYTDHNYLYMCAKEDFSGRHNFAATHREHQNNAAKYHNALNNRGIY